MKKGSLIFITFFLYLAQADAKEVNFLTSEVKDGLTYEINSQTPFTGQFVQRFNDGTVKIKGRFKNGKNVGAWERWHSNGHQQYRLSFKDGEYDGLFTEWLKSGQKKEEGRYKIGKKHGAWIKWYGNGQVQEEIHYKNDLKHGKSSNWRDNGSRIEEESFKRGQRTGPYTTWHFNGKKESIGQFKNDKPHGEFKGWHDNGQLYRQGQYNKIGNKEGRFISWNKHGKKLYEDIYEDGTLIDTRIDFSY